MDTGSDVRDFVSHWRQDPTGRDDELVVAKVKYQSVARVARWREMKRAGHNSDEDTAQEFVEDNGDDTGGFSDSEQRHLRQHCAQEPSPFRHVRPQSASTTRRNGDPRDCDHSVGQRRPQSASASRRGGDVSSPQRRLQQLKEFAWMPAEIQRSKWTEMLRSSPGFQEQSLQRLEAETYALLKKVLQKRPATSVKREKKSVKTRKRNGIETGADQLSPERSLAVGSGLQVVRKSKSKAVKAPAADCCEKASKTTTNGSGRKNIQAEAKAPPIKAKTKTRAQAAQTRRVRPTKVTVDDTKLTDKELKKRDADAEARLRLMQEMGWLDDVGLRRSPKQRDAVADEETPPVTKTKKKKAKARARVLDLTGEASQCVRNRPPSATDDDADCLIQELLLEVPRDPCNNQAVLSHETEACWSDTTTIRIHGEADDDSGKISQPKPTSAIEAAEAQSGTREVSNDSVIGTGSGIPNEEASEPRYNHAHLSPSNTERYEDDCFEGESTRQTISCDQEEDLAGEQAGRDSLEQANSHVSVLQKQPNGSTSAFDEVAGPVPLPDGVDDCSCCETASKITRMDMEMQGMTPREPREEDDICVFTSEEKEVTTEVHECVVAARTIQRQYGVFRNRGLLLDQVRFLAQKQRRKKRKMSRRPSSSAYSAVTEAIVAQSTLEVDHVNEEVERQDPHSMVETVASSRREDVLGASDTSDCAGGEELQEDAKDILSADASKLSADSLVDELPSTEMPTDTFIADESEGPCASPEVLSHGLEPELVRGPPVSSLSDDHENLTGVEVGRSVAQHGTDSVSHLPTAAHALVATDDATSSLADAGRSTINDATQVDDFAAIVSSRSCPPSSQACESCVAEPHEEQDQWHFPIGGATGVLATPRVWSESNEKTDNREERDLILHNGVLERDHSVCAVINAVGGECTAGGENCMREEVDGSSFESGAVAFGEAELTDLEEDSESEHRHTVEETLSFDPEVTTDHEQVRMKATARIQQCWRDHRNPGEKVAITEDLATMETSMTHGSGSEMDESTRSASIETEWAATPPVRVADVNAPEELSYGVASQPSEEEFPATKTSEGNALVIDLEQSGAAASVDESAVKANEREIRSATTSTSVTVLEDRSLVMRHVDEPVGGSSSMPSTQPDKEAHAAVRIQRQYRRFVYRRAILDQLGFFVRQHRRETRRKTRRLSADAAVVSVVLEPLIEVVRAEDVRGQMPEQLVTMVTIVETVDAELRPAPPDTHPKEKTTVVDQRHLLAAAFESAPEDNDDEDATNARTHTVNLGHKPDAQGANANEGDEEAKLTDLEPRVLAATWGRYMDTSANKSFYFHATRRVSQWDRPVNEVVVDKTIDQDTVVEDAIVTSTGGEEVASTTTSETSPPSPERWERYMDSDTNKSFYFHPKRRVSRWDRPVEEPVVDCVAAAEALSEPLAGEPLAQDAHTEAASQRLSWWQHVKEQATLLESNGGWDRYLTREDAVVFYHHAGRDEFHLESDSGVPDEFTQAKTALLGPTGDDTSPRWTLRRNRSLKGDKRGEWQAFVDTETHQTFYFNTLTGESTWEKPLAFQQQPTTEHVSAGYEWVMYVDARTALPYYVNLATNVTSWEKPPDFDQATSDRDLSRLHGIGEHSGAAAPTTDREEEDADVEQDEYVISIHDDRGADEWLAA